MYKHIQSGVQGSQSNTLGSDAEILNINIIAVVSEIILLFLDPGKELGINHERLL